MTPATASTPILSQLHGKKRAHSALELLTLNASFLPKKKPRIQEIEDTSADSSGLPSVAGTPNIASGIALVSSDEAETDELQSSSGDSSANSEDESSDSDSDSGSSSGASSHESAQATRSVRADPGDADVIDDNSSSSSSSSTSSSSSSDAESSDVESPAGLLPPSGVPLSTPDTSTTELYSRLKDFLPAIQSANAELEAARASGNLDERNIENLGSQETEGAGQYIEMDLGLGVLEEKRDSDSASSSGCESGYASDSDGASQDQTPTTPSHDYKSEASSRQDVLEKAAAAAACSSASSPSSNGDEASTTVTTQHSHAKGTTRTKRNPRQKSAALAERDVLGKLMGGRQRRARPGIQVIDERG